MVGRFWEDYAFGALHMLLLDFFSLLMIALTVWLVLFFFFFNNVNLVRRENQISGVMIM